MVWRGMSRYVKRHSITCFKALSWAIVPFTHGVADVSGDPVHTQSAFYMHVPFTCSASVHPGQG